jgi:uncharacterized membrane protein
MNNKIAKIIAIFLGISYPCIVYYFSKSFSGYYFISMLIAVLVLRAIINKKSSLISLSVAVVLAIAAYIIGEKASMLYPVIMNLAMCIVFGYSLKYPPTIIERFARLQTPNLNRSAILYTRTVTKIWLGFFLINATIAIITVWIGDLKHLSKTNAN